MRVSTGQRRSHLQNCLIIIQHFDTHKILHKDARSLIYFIHRDAANAREFVYKYELPEEQV